MEYIALGMIAALATVLINTVMDSLIKPDWENVIDTDQDIWVLGEPSQTVILKPEQNKWRA